MRIGEALNESPLARSLRCALPTFARTGECTRAMTNDARLEIRLPARRLRELDELAAESPVSRADLVRLGINWLIEHPDVILKFPEAAA